MTRLIGSEHPVPQAGLGGENHINPAKEEEKLEGCRSVQCFHLDPQATLPQAILYTQLELLEMVFHNLPAERNPGPMALCW